MGIVRLAFQILSLISAGILCLWDFWSIPHQVLDAAVFMLVFYAMYIMTRLLRIKYDVSAESVVRSACLQAVFSLSLFTGAVVVTYAIYDRIIPCIALIALLFILDYTVYPLNQKVSKFGTWWLIGLRYALFENCVIVMLLVCLPMKILHNEVVDIVQHYIVISLIIPNICLAIYRNEYNPFIKIDRGYRITLGITGIIMALSVIIPENYAGLIYWITVATMITVIIKIVWLYLGVSILNDGSPTLYATMVANVFVSSLFIASTPMMGWNACVSALTITVIAALIASICFNAVNEHTQSSQN